jgi:hypothetical protein
MVESGVSVNFLDTNMLEGAMVALSKRVADLEGKIKTPCLQGELADEQHLIKMALLRDPKQKLAPVFQSILASKLIPICNRIAQIEAQMPLKPTLNIEQAQCPKVEVPKDLRLIVGKNGKMKNRTADVVQRRWAIWKIQSEAGIPLSAIAKAWNCDHGSICYAKKKRWSCYKKKGGAK